MNAASTGQLLLIARKVAADLTVVFCDADLTVEIAAANGSMRDEGWLLTGMAKSPSTSERTTEKWPSRKVMCAGVQMGWSCRVTMARKSDWRLRWTAATGK
jgi:hypothetical protein